MQVAAYPWPFRLLDELVEQTRPDVIVRRRVGPGSVACTAPRGAAHHSMTVTTTDYYWTGRPRQRVKQFLFFPLRHAVFDAA